MTEDYRTKTGKVLTDNDIQALADEAEQGYDVSHLLGVVDPQQQTLEGMPPNGRLEEVVGGLTQAWREASDKLVSLRAQREEINAEIKLLVGEEELLERMIRAARKRPSRGRTGAS